MMSTPAGLAAIEEGLDTFAHFNGSLWRVFVRWEDVLSGPTTVNHTALALLDKAQAMAMQRGLRMTVTGLVAFWAVSVPNWVADADDASLLRASALWWGTLAARWRGSRGVFSYDLMNEPVWSWRARPPTPVAIGCIIDQCFDFVQNKRADASWRSWVHKTYKDEAALRAAWPSFQKGSLDPGYANETYDHPAIPPLSWSDLPARGLGGVRRTVGIPPVTNGSERRHEDYVTHMMGMRREWAATLTKAIKAADPAARVSVGVLGVAESAQWLEGIADYYSLHLYPAEDCTTRRAMRTFFANAMATLPQDGKPAFVEEFFPWRNSAVSAEDLLGALLDATQNRTFAYTTFMCRGDGVVSNTSMCEEWLRLTARRLG